MLPQKQPESFFKERIIIPTTKFHPEQLEEMEEDIAPHQKLHMTEYSSTNQGIIKEAYHTYYCSICGRVALISEVPIQKYLLRKTDQAQQYQKSICIDLENKFSKHWLKQGDSRYISRDNGIEQQFIWHCECGTIVGYQCCPFKDTEQLEKLKALENLDDDKWKEFQPKNKLILYIYQDSLVVDMVFCKLITKFDEMYNA